jgi:hypothetical protein
MNILPDYLILIQQIFLSTVVVFEMHDNNVLMMNPNSNQNC